MQVKRGLRSRKIKCAVIAPNIDEGSSAGGLDDNVQVRRAALSESGTQGREMGGGGATSRGRGQHRGGRGGGGGGRRGEGNLVRSGIVNKVSDGERDAGNGTIENKDDGAVDAARGVDEGEGSSKDRSKEAEGNHGHAANDK